MPPGTPTPAPKPPWTWCARSAAPTSRDAGFPAGDHVYLTGAPAFGLDFVNKAYGAFPWLLLAVLVITYFVLLRAFRSVVLPIKAVLMNLLSITASYGALVLVFQHGWGEVVGFHSSPQIEAWIPIFLFAMLFGLSMDYEIFLLTRMREEWDRHHDNERAVAFGLERTGRIITAAAVIMIAAFSGLMSGHLRGPAGVRLRPGDRDLPRRHDRAGAAGARADEAARTLELVPARAHAAHDAPASRGRAGLEHLTAPPATAATARSPQGRLGPAAGLGRPQAQASATGAG